jgi:hypothetical protein
MPQFRFLMRSLRDDDIGAYEKKYPGTALASSTRVN